MKPEKAAAIVSTGRALPVGRVTNLDLEEIVDTNDEWIRTRTGIRERRMVNASETNADLSVSAARLALERAALRPEDVDLLIVATVTPDQPLPSSACLVQAKLNAYNAFAFDLAAGCTGFLYGLHVADKFIKTGSAKNILLIGVDILSPIIDWQDRNTCVLFGDGAGAVVVKEAKGSGGLKAARMFSDGSKAGLLYIPGGGTRLPPSGMVVEKRLHYVKMNGPEIFKFAVKIMAESTQQVLEMCAKSPQDLDYLIPHQANMRIIEAACKRLGIDLSKVLINIERYGNMSSASIPVVLDEAVEEGKIKSGDLIAMVAFGAGLTWGAALLEW